MIGKRFFRIVIGLLVGLCFSLEQRPAAASNLSVVNIVRNAIAIADSGNGMLAIDGKTTRPLGSVPYCCRPLVGITLGRLILL